jgi:ADP-heptose:LPS heptosyltransferase
MNPRKILAIKLRSLGDTVLMTASIEALKRAYPLAEIHVAVLTAWAPLLEDQPSIQKVWRYDRHPDRASRAKAAVRLALKLRKQKFDCVVNFHASPTSAMIAFATGAKIRSIHFHGHKDKNRYSTVTIPGKGTLKPIIERDMDAIRALGLKIPTGNLPVLCSRTAEAAWAKDFVNRIGQGKPILALGLGASRPTKSWPIERFAALAVQWSRTQEGAALALAGPQEDTLRKEFLKSVDDILSSSVSDASERTRLRSRISAESRLNLREITAFLGAASVFVGNDSGPKHIAVATGTPTVTLFGPEHPLEWHPYSATQHPYFFIENLACRKDAEPGMPPWCALDLCTQEQHKCMRLIGSDAVLEKCVEVRHERKAP